MANARPSLQESQESVNQAGQPWTKRITLAGAQGWTAIVTSMVAVIISTLTWLDVHQRPQLMLTIPSQIRIAQGDQIWLYIQPTLSLLEQTDVVTRLSLQLNPQVPAPRATPRFTWNETGEWIYDPTKSL
ncbi:MAG: hypothetical protein ACRDRX_19510 [Pseudonocardiaceae bacterium]